MAPLTRMLLFGAGVALVCLLLFAAVEAVGVPLLRDPGPWLERGGPLAAALGIGLLVLDVVAPVPSSLVMVAHGALLGIALGTLVSLVGSVGAAATGFWVGRRSEALVARLVPAVERRRADELLQRWGDLAVIVTRPVPILAETVTIVAGTTRLRWGRLLLASAAGSLPPALLFAATGATAVTVSRTSVVMGAVLAMAGLFWLLGRRRAQPSAPPRRRPESADRPACGPR